MLTWKLARSPPLRVQAETLTRPRLLPTLEAGTIVDLNVSRDPPSSRQIEISLSIVLGMNIIKGKSNDFILMETVILPHAPIFHENM